MTRTSLGNGGIADARHDSNLVTPQRRSEGHSWYTAHCKTLKQSIAPGMRGMRDEVDSVEDGDIVLAPTPQTRCRAMGLGAWPWRNVAASPSGRSNLLR